MAHFFRHVSEGLKKKLSDMACYAAPLPPLKFLGFFFLRFRVEILHFRATDKCLRQVNKEHS